MALSSSGAAIATAEQLMLHVASSAGKSVAALPHFKAKLATIAEADALLERPEGFGSHVGQNR